MQTPCRDLADHEPVYAARKPTPARPAGRRRKFLQQFMLPPTPEEGTAGPRPAEGTALAWKCGSFDRRNAVRCDRGRHDDAVGIRTGSPDFRTAFQAAVPRRHQGNPRACPAAHGRRCRHCQLWQGQGTGSRGPQLGARDRTGLCAPLQAPLLHGGRHLRGADRAGIRPACGRGTGARRPARPTHRSAGWRAGLLAGGLGRAFARGLRRRQ